MSILTGTVDALSQKCVFYMKYKNKNHLILTLDNMVSFDDLYNYWQWEPSYRPHNESMLCASSVYMRETDRETDCHYVLKNPNLL